MFVRPGHLGVEINSRYWSILRMKQDLYARVLNKIKPRKSSKTFGDQHISKTRTPSFSLIFSLAKIKGL